MWAFGLEFTLIRSLSNTQARSFTYSYLGETKAGFHFTDPQQFDLMRNSGGQKGPFLGFTRFPFPTQSFVINNSQDWHTGYSGL